jgi:acyl-CoA synthetase (AMP-forming)/AMP-acid ligase II
MIAETVPEAARRFGDRPAFVDEGGATLGYAELDRRSDAVAVGLVRRGIGERDVVALALRPGIDYVVAYAAVSKVAAITAGINDRLSGPERDALVKVAGAALIVDNPDELADLACPGESPAPLPHDPERPVAIVFTSGTTGTPRGALFGYRQLAFIAATEVGDRWGGGDATIAGTAFAHLGFMTKLPGNLRRGGTAHIMARWRAEDALALIAEHRVSIVAGVPTQLALMLRAPAFDRFDFSHVRGIVVGGSPTTPDLVAEARRRFDAPLAVRYSCTEAGLGVVTTFEDDEEDAMVSVGRPLPGIELAILDDADVALPPGEVGSVCLRSPAVMTEYHHDAAATSAAFTAEGFVRTGDLGYRDDQGRLRLVGRAKEMYVRGGYNVYPVEVEAVLATHPAIAEVAVVGRPDPVMGEIGIAVVVPADPNEPVDIEMLRAHGSQHLAPYKLPEVLEIVDELPLTTGDKVDRHALARGALH